MFFFSSRRRHTRYIGDWSSDVCSSDLITADVDKYPASVRKYADHLRGRSMLVRRAEIFPVECIARGYISGSEIGRASCRERVEVYVGAREVEEKEVVARRLCLT